MSDDIPENYQEKQLALAQEALGLLIRFNPEGVVENLSKGAKVVDMLLRKIDYHLRQATGVDAAGQLNYVLLDTDPLGERPMPEAKTAHIARSLQEATQKAKLASAIKCAEALLCLEDDKIDDQKLRIALLDCIERFASDIALTDYSQLDLHKQTDNRNDQQVRELLEKQKRKMGTSLPALRESIIETLNGNPSDTPYDLYTALERLKTGYRLLGEEQSIDRPLIDAVKRYMIAQNAYWSNHPIAAPRVIASEGEDKDGDAAIAEREARLYETCRRQEILNRAKYVTDDIQAALRCTTTDHAAIAPIIDKFSENLIAWQCAHDRQERYDDERHNWLFQYPPETLAQAEAALNGHRKE